MSKPAVTSPKLAPQLSASFITSPLYGVRPRDPGVFTLVPLLLLEVAIAASYIPDRRATKMDLIVALREV